MIGITSTIPVEIVFAAGRRPADLNNLFIAAENPQNLISQSEAIGFSYNTCAWIKGIYATTMTHHIKEMIAVTGGDCSNTIALGELLARKGVRILPFEYPQDKDPEKLWLQMDLLRKGLGTTWDDIRRIKRSLDKIREKLNQLDCLTWQENRVSGFENHLFLVSSSDFNSDPKKFEKDLDLFISEAEKRPPFEQPIRLGYLGVPCILSGLYEYIESMGGRVVYNEVQRQFAMPFGHQGLVEQYLAYTYPYDVAGRLADVRAAVQVRHLDGLIHYTQTFCHRQMYDMILRDEFETPILTLEGDRPGPMDARISLRIESFMEMLRGQKGL